MREQERYAQLLLRCGVDLQPGQTLCLTIPVEHYDFARIVAREAYELGAEQVRIHYTDAHFRAIRADECLYPNTGIPRGYTDEKIELLDYDTVYLTLRSSISATGTKNPEYEDKLLTAEAEEEQRFKRAMRNHPRTHAVCKAIIPSIPWARECFPYMEDDIANILLWDYLYELSLAKKENGVDLWNERIESFQRRVRILNEKQFTKLHFYDTKTNLEVDLVPRHVWTGACELDDQGHRYMHDFPTEKIFTAPARNGVNGSLHSSRPLWFNNREIKGITLHFKDGKVYSFQSETGMDALEEMLNYDEGSRYTGEIALVPGRNPIQNTGMVFNCTLLDQNAGCHIALGSAYQCSVEEKIPFEEEPYLHRNLNYAGQHRDIVFGTEDINVDAYNGEEKTVLLANGEWMI